MVQKTFNTQMDILDQIGIKMNAQQQEQLFGRVEERQKEKIDSFGVYAGIKKDATDKYNNARIILLNDLEDNEYVGNTYKVKVQTKQAVVDIDYKSLVESLPKTKKLLEKMEEFKKTTRKETRTITVEKL